jgi:hypothetical protein
MQLSHMSRTDYLAGLANRAAFNDIPDESFRAPGIGLDSSAMV